MVGGVEGPRVALWSGAGSDGEFRELLHHRLRVYSRVVVPIVAVLFGLVVLMYTVYPDTAPPRVGLVYASSGAAIAGLFGAWILVLGRSRPSVRAMWAVDVFYVSAPGIALAVSAYLCVGRPAQMYTAFIWNAFIVFTRALIVPSSPRRTTAVSTIGMTPVLVAGLVLSVAEPALLDLRPTLFAIGLILMAGLSVLLARTGSSVIYGLREQVREAKQLGQYSLERKIGEGGMGAVYRATHSMLRRPTAIKLLRPERYGEDNLRRFEREVRATSQLTHPNTIEIYDYGRSPDGVFYYAMEYLDGLNLSELVDSYGPQPAARVIHILCQVCGALEEAHECGLIHRDVKPANILLCERGQIPDVAKVLDFGLVKQMRSTNSSLKHAVAGTPAFVSPEAVTDPDSVGFATDLYALGAVAYYLLAGVLVFDAANEIDLCVRHVSSEPRPPSERTSNPIPEALESLIMSCLEKSPADRPKSASALRRALEDLAVEHPWPEDVARAWWLLFRETDHNALLAASAQMVTVDLSDRRPQSDVDRELPSHKEDTGQAT